VPYDGQRQVLGGDPDAVVGDADQTNAAGFEIDHDARGAGIESVVEQFLDDRSRPLDDLAGGDLVDGVRVEDSDACHVRPTIAQRSDRPKPLSARVPPPPPGGGSDRHRLVESARPDAQLDAAIERASQTRQERPRQLPPNALRIQPTAAGFETEDGGSCSPIKRRDRAAQAACTAAASVRRADSPAVPKRLKPSKRSNQTPMLRCWRAASPTRSCSKACGVVAFVAGGASAATGELAVGSAHAATGMALVGDAAVSGLASGSAAAGCRAGAVEGATFAAGVAGRDGAGAVLSSQRAITSANPSRRSRSKLVKVRLSSRSRGSFS
jgi:hypothetical protein